MSPFQKITLLFFVLVLGLNTQAQVGINTENPDASAVLELESTSQGFLPPRMTADQRDAIVAPATGLIFYCSNCGPRGELQIYNGSIWTNAIGGVAANGTAIGSDTGSDSGTGLNAAPTPSQDSADVIAVFSDAYTSIANNLNPNWGQQTNATEIQIDGNNILKYENLNYQGLDYPQTDVSSMEYVHLDYKTADASSIEFSLISANPTIDTPYSIDIVTGGWQSIDIPLSVYTANLDRVFQFKTVGNGTVYLDNIYFWKAPSAAGTDTSLSALTVNGSSIAGFGPTSTNYSVELPAGTTVAPAVAATPTDTNASAVVTAATSIPGTTTVAITSQDGSATRTISIDWTLDSKPQTAAPTPTWESDDVISVYSDAFTENIATNLNPDWGQGTQTTEVQIDGNNALEYENLNYQGLDFSTTDVSAMEYVHLDYYTNDATALDLFLISTGPLENAYPIPVVTGSWQSIDIPLSAYTVPELDKVFSFKTVGDGTVYFDNIYFWKALASTPPNNSTAAPTPSQDSADVISVYSDAYSSIATNLNPNWGQQTQTTEIQIDGNNTLEYANLNYQGLDYPQTDVSAMEYVHLDYKTADATAIDFFLISANPTVENPYPIPVVTGDWQSIDIPLSVYTANLDRVFNFKTVGNGTVWFDNIYFWKAPTAAGTDTSLSDLTVNGSTIAGFGPTSASYSLELPVGTSSVPVVAVTTTDVNASAVITAATSIPGTTTVVVTAQDGTTTSTVSIAWSIDPKPQTAAPVPSQDSADVISVFSDAYTNLNANLNPNWGQQTQTTEVQIDGNNTLEYANLNYQGLEYPQTDVSSMEYVHLDYKTADATAIDFFLISANPTVENPYPIPVVTGDWQSIDIPLSVYTANLDRVFNFKTVGNGTVWFDNIYFWKAPTAAGTDTSLSDLTVNGSTIAGFGPTSASYSLELPVGTSSVPVVAVTTTDVNASAVITAATSIPGTTTVVVTAQDGTTTSTVSIAWSIDPKPQTAAPVPSQDSADVVSVYSDAFTENIATNLNPGWGQATQTTEVQIDGNNTLEYANLNYQGLEYPQTDVSAMEYLHLDYHTSDATSLEFFLISANPSVENALHYYYCYMEIGKVLTFHCQYTMPI